MPGDRRQATVWSIPGGVTGESAEAVIGSVEIRGLRCRGRHGTSAGEQDETRTFVVDIQVWTDITRAATTDSLEDALDIAALAATVREVISGPPRGLLERLTLEVARTLMRRFPSVERARVRLGKPEPPGLDAIEEAVELTLSRA
jgi:7,8-dihydroneopterin aldolase/epimerase/oxygenase